MLRFLCTLLLLFPLYCGAQSNSIKRVYHYVKFSEVPTEDQKEALKEADVTLHQYQPNLVWFSSFPEGLSTDFLITNGASQVFQKPLSKKADPRILANRIPDYAYSQLGIQFFLTVAKGGDYDLFSQALNEKGIMVNSIFEPLGIIEAIGSRESLLNALDLPFVLYAELPEPPAELEIEDEMTMTRGAYINGYYNLNGVNGAGITIAVNEGGRVDSIYEPDYKNRLNRTWESGGASGHKTGVSMRMCSAGNLDPQQRGQAWGATLWSGGINFTNAAQANVNIVNNSFGYGCISGTATYNSGAAINDYLVRTNSRFMITYSCGNIGGSNCAAYGAGAGWGSITGLVKSAKNIFAVGAMSTNDQLTGFSSKGPAMDGRILPDITATGPGGTSFASPNLAGVNALLTQAYRNSNNNQWPASGLIKAIVLNTADDMENPGPDFRTGFGRVNAKRGLNLIQSANIITDSVANNATKTHSVAIPAGVSQVKVSLYWTDYEAAPGITGKTLVNNLDLRVQSPGGVWSLPWVLNTFPHNDSLMLPAVNGVDTLNNIELITLDNPASGNYTIEVTGDLVPFGPQTYHVVYSFVYDSIEVVYPMGGEGLVAGEQRRIRWDAFNSGSPFSIEFSADSGSTWQSVASGIASDLRTYTWTVPAVQSGECMVRVQSGSLIGASNVFTIVNPPSNLQRVWRCADSALVSWDSVPGALGYRVYRLGSNFMDTVGFTQQPYHRFYNLSASNSEWVTVQSVLPDSGSSRRAIALEIPTSTHNCVGTDLAAIEIKSPQAGHYPSCLAASALPVKILVQNTGTAGLTQLPVAFRLNSGNVFRDTLFTSLSSPASALLTFTDSVTLQNGLNSLKVWTEYPQDANALNDTLEIELFRYFSTGITLPYTQSFDSFTGCSTAWGCGTISCSLSQGWYNVPNNAQGDSIDWRTHSGATGSGGTGPTGDHTTGNGKYLYLEGSGNGGSGCQNSVAMLQSPCIDLSQTNAPELSFWYHALGNSVGSMHVDVLANGEWHEDVMLPITGDQGNQWVQHSVSLAAFVGEEITIRLRGVTGNGWATDMAIDDINITSQPLANFTTVYDTFCLGQTVPLQNLSTYATAYNWNIQPSTYSFSSGNANSTSPVILPTDTGWYTVELVATSGTGSDTLTTQLFYVGSFTSVGLISNTPNSTYCYADTATFTAFGFGGQYDFYLNGNLVQTGLAHTYSTSNFSQGDSLYVINRVNTTCSVNSSVIYLHKQPNYASSLLSTTTPLLLACQGDTVGFTAVVGMSQYTFRINGNVVSNSSNNFYETTNLNNGDDVYCEITDSLGCTGNSDTLIFTINPIPPTPVISLVQPDSLYASTPADLYEWAKDGQLINYQTQTIPVLGNGLYTVNAQKDGCWSATSAPFEYWLFGVSSIESENVKIYPNPSNGNFWVDINPREFNMLRMYDQTGKQISVSPILEQHNEVELNNVAPGLYLLQLSGANGVVNAIMSIN